MRSLFGTLLFWLSIVYSFGQDDNITAMEYYIDTDPGVGSGTAISVTSGAVQDIDVNISTSSLSVGFHQLVIRAMDDDADWGINESRIFYVSSSDVAATSDIASIEYFFDSDPGFGNATAIGITQATTIDMTELLSTSSLSVGFHQLVIRSQDANGVWGINESRVVYVSASDVTTTSDITAIEYFFDTDPGYGNGTAVSLTQATTLDVDEMISTSALSEGFHELIIRAQDENGVWGIQESRAVFVSASDVTTTSDIAAIEYFFDTDPGHGNGTSISITQAASIDIDEMVAASALSAGFHVLMVRAQDANGVWGIQEARSFFTSTSSVTSVNNVAAVEYYFDTDPGYGSGTPISITSSSTIDVDALIASSTLSQGAHVLVVRARDDQGVWGMPQSKAFFVRSSDVTTPSSLASIEYYIDADPGIGAATQIAISPSQASIDQDFVVPTSSLANGTYAIGVRVSNDNSEYSLTSSAEFTICNVPTPDFTATTVCVGTATAFTDMSTAEAGDSYSWDFDGDGNEDSSSEGDVSFTYLAAGTYIATLTLDRSGCADQTSVTVIVEEVPVADAGMDQTVMVDQASLGATPAGAGETGTWTIISGTAVLSDINDESASLTSITSNEVILRWTVVNDIAGCSDEDEVTITYSEPLSGETDILTFVLPELTGAAEINSTAHTVDAEVARGTGLAALSPTITISDGATISPLSGAVQSFESAVIYTVTAEDGTTTQEWVVTVTEQLNTETDILSFDFQNIDEEVSIDVTTHNVDITVPKGVDLNSLTPSIVISEGATISPMSGVAQSYLDPVIYTVTAEDGMASQDWTVTVMEELSSEAEILGFSLAEQIEDAAINTTDGTIMLLVEFGTDLGALSPEISLSEGATIDPSGAQDFTNSVTYTVTAEDGITTKSWIATIAERPLSLESYEVEVFPNPTRDMILINGLESGFYFEVIDMSGKTLLTGRDATHISLKDLPPGSYTLLLQTKQDRVNKRIVKH